MKYLTQLTILLFSLPILNLRAEPLSTYRSQVKALAGQNIDAQATKRVDDLKNDLGNFGLNNINLDPNYPKFKVRPKREFSSSFFKRTVTPIAEKLRLKDMYDVPKVMDPSVYQHDEATIEQKEQEALAAFEKEIKNFDSMLMQLYDTAQAQAAPAVKLDQGEAAYEARVTAAVEKVIVGSEPRSSEKSEKLKSILELLGPLVRAEIYDGYVTRLVFKSKITRKTDAGEKALESELPVSLSMLINIRTLRDTYFIKSLHLMGMKLLKEISPYIEKEKDKKTLKVDAAGNLIPRKLKWDEEFRYAELRDSMAFVQKELMGALFTSEVVTRLNKVQLNFLIELMLSLRLPDVPVEDELGDLASFVFAKYQNKEIPTPTPPEIIDMNFYKQMNDELRNLSDFLVIEAPVKKVIESERKTK